MTVVGGGEDLLLPLEHPERAQASKTAAASPSDAFGIERLLRPLT
jgi:hypothetical protein